MRILALDIGKKKIGMAVSDALGITAQPYETLIRKNKKYDFERIKQIVFAMRITKIVAGLPINMDGTEGPMAQAIYDFAKELKEIVEVPIEFWDERLTTMEAERLMLEADLSRKKRKKLDDRMAAQLILQGYMDKKT